MTYIYHVRTIDPLDGGYSGEVSDLGAYDYATTATTLWADAAITPYVTLARAQHIEELRGAVDAFRVAFGLSRAFATAEAPSGAILAANVTGVITALNEARQGRYAPFAYTGGVPSPQPQGLILAEHIRQLRNAVH